MNTSTIMRFVKNVATVAVFAVLIFGAYSAVGYVTNTLTQVDAVAAAGCGGCGGGLWWFDGGYNPSDYFGSCGGWCGGGGDNPTPQCTLDLTREYITWTTSYVTNVSIVPLTASPLIPQPTNGGGTGIASPSNFAGSALPADMASDGISYNTSKGIAADPTTLNYICKLYYGPTSTVADYDNTSFDSCSNNTILKWTGTEWVEYNACQNNSKIRNVLTCNVPGSGYALNGTHNFVPPLGVGTHTYKLTGSGQYGTVMCEDTIVVPPPPSECELEITKEASETSLAPGDFVAYTINFKNTGDKKCTGSGVKVADTLDANLIYHSETHSSNVSAGYNSDPVYDAGTRTVYWNAWDLDPGEAGWVKVIAKAATPSSCSVTVPNKARITSYEYNNFTTWVYSNIVNLTINKDCTPPPTECQLEIVKSANKTNVVSGDQIEYTLTFKNKGQSKCTGSGVKIMDVLDSRLTYNSETHSSNVDAGYNTIPLYNSATRTLSWNAWDLDPAETGWVKFKVTVGTPAACSESVPNTGKISSFEYNNFGIWVTSNAVNISLTKDCTPPPQKCELEIEKSVNDTSVEGGDVVEYTITFKNTGNKKCTGDGVLVADVLASGLTYQSESHSGNVAAGYVTYPVYNSGDRTLRWNAYDLDPGETGWVKFKAKVNTIYACSVVIPNTAKITAKEYSNFNTWVESNLVNITVTKDCHVPVPYCTLSGSPTTIAVGQSATLSWNSTNVTTVTIDKGVGPVALSGSTQVSPTVTTTYTGTFVGPGGTVTCNTTITVTGTPPGPACTLSVSASRINPGQSIFVSWTSTNAVSGFITGNVGTTSPVSAGSYEIYPSDDTTYVGTFTAANGQTVTCQAPVTINKGGGGCIGSCGGGLNQPNVVLLQKPGDAPLAFVSLSQIPYTGFEAGTALTIIFWTAVGLLAALAAYFVMGKGGTQFLLGTALQYAGVSTGRYEDEDEGRAMPATYTENNYNYSAAVAPAPVASIAVAPHIMPAAAAKVANDGIPELADVVESRAHGAGVLMSPEAVQMALALAPERGQILQRFGDILNEAVKTIPREDGWILLTSERFEELAGKTPAVAPVATVAHTPSVESILASVMTPPAMPAARNVEMPMTNADDQSVVMSLVRAILKGNRDAAYQVARSLEIGGANGSTVMTIIATSLDQLYRARRHGTTTELTTDAAGMTDEALASLVEIFAHGMDHGYSNAFTGLKLAVAQAFEVRG